MNADGLPRSRLGLVRALVSRVVSTKPIDGDVAGDTLAVDSA